MSTLTEFSVEGCTALHNATASMINGPFCTAYFDRIACWPPTLPGVRSNISCPPRVFVDAAPEAYALRLCTNESKWEDKGDYSLCMGCSPADAPNSTSGQSFSLPDAYIVTRRYFVVCADGLSIVLLACGILILLGNSRLRQCSRNILHVNVFLVFLIRSAIQLFTELYMTRGYFARNVFERVDACNRTSTYFKENQLLDCQLFTMFMNYINSSVSHWFVFCEALYLFRLLRAEGYKDRVRWYILTGWLAPLVLTAVTYTTRYIVKTGLHTCWFEPSRLDWILHGPNVILQFFNVIIFVYICVLLARKLNKTYRTAASSDHGPFAKYSRLTRSTLILLPVFGIHYFLFIWNMKPMLIPSLILIHLTVHTISSSLQGIIVALIYTLINSEVQREMLRSFDRCLTRHHGGWQQPNFFRDYMGKLENDRIYSLGYRTRSNPTPIRYRPPTQFTGMARYPRCTNQHRYSVSNRSRQDSIKTAAALAQELALMNPNNNRRSSTVNLSTNPNPVVFTTS